MLKNKNIQSNIYFHTIGGKRFKVLSRGVKDGYNTAKVEYLHDEVLEGEDLESKCLKKNSMFVKSQFVFCGVLCGAATVHTDRPPECCSFVKKTSTESWDRNIDRKMHVVGRKVIFYVTEDTR